MFFKNSLYLFLACALSFNLLNAVKPEETLCDNEGTCTDLDNNCSCYCSGICGPRDKKDDDDPIWVKNDPNKHHCYCKKWDLEVYRQRGCHLNVHDEDSRSRSMRGRPQR